MRDKFEYSTYNLGAIVNGNNTLGEEIRERISKENKAFCASKTLFYKQTGVQEIQTKHIRHN
jgi:hypothetical protein